MIFSVLAICLGACFGAVCRWGFNLLLNPLFSAIPLGTLAVNLLGSLIMGFLMAFFAFYPGISTDWKLLLITGFLGSFTTFSAFAGELAVIIQSGRYLLCAGAISLHVFGSIIMVFSGLTLFKLIFGK